MSWKTELIEHLRTQWITADGKPRTRILRPNAHKNAAVTGNFADQRSNLTASISLLRKETLELHRPRSLVRETHLFVISIRVPEETEVERLEMYQALLTGIYQNRRVILPSADLVFAESEEWPGEPVEEAKAWEGAWKSLFYREMHPP